MNKFFNIITFLCLLSSGMVNIIANEEVVAEETTTDSTVEPEPVVVKKAPLKEFSEKLKAIANGEQVDMDETADLFRKLRNRNFVGLVRDLRRNGINQKLIKKLKKVKAIEKIKRNLMVPAEDNTLQDTDDSNRFQDVFTDLESR